MPLKSSNKKSASNATASWYHCEACDAHITSKERETHEKICPIEPDAGVAGLEYIRSNCLYTCNVEHRTFNVEELKDMPAKYINNLVFISEGAMRLSHLHIGQKVVIRCAEETENSGPTFVRLAWPIPEKFLTTIFVSDEDFNQNWLNLKLEAVKIEAMPTNCTSPAKIVYLIMSSKTRNSSRLTESQLTDVKRLLKYELRYLIFTTKSLIHMDFFNKDLVFVVDSWSECNEVISSDNSLLEEAFQNLSLKNSKTSEFFVVNSSTDFEIKQSLAENVDDARDTNSATKANIGGSSEQINMIEECMNMALGFRVMPNGVKLSRGILLYGPSGCGKSLMCEAMCTAVRQQSATVIRINTSELFSKFLGETEKNLTTHFDKAFANYPRPTLIIVEDVHNLCPKHETNELAKRVCISFLSALDTLSSGRKEAQHIFLLATTSQIHALNPNVRRSGRLDSEVEISAPMPKQRAAILNCLLRNVEHDITDENINEVAQVLHGYVGADIANLIYNASLCSLKDNNRKLNIQDVRKSLTHVKPSAMREVLIENPNVHWDDIGGQTELKLKLKQAIEWPLLYPEKFKRLGLKPPRGILMFGPPGCSKTMIAKALATESQLNFLSIKGPELFSMWVGESERAVREVFRKARQVAPAIVFFDEIDAIGGERAEGGSTSGTSVKERVLTQLLTEMDGVETLENVTIVAATNRPDMIDKALLRPGRIDRIIYVGLPDAKARSEICHIKLRSTPLAQDVDIGALADRTEGYSGAEIQAVCQEAALKCLEGSFEAEHVTWQHFEYALDLLQPRTSPELLRLYETYMKKS